MANRNQFISHVESCVEDMLEGVAATFPQLSVDPKSGIVLCPESSTGNERKVGLLSGGGSGHEPFAAGYVGEGMLTAAVAGSVFASPPPSHILSAICNVASISPGGVLLIFNNYTGDVLNFGLALERAKGLGYNIKSVVLDEDCSIDKPEGAGKRGLCGCLFVIKIAGSLASMSKSLEEIYKECAVVKDHVATLGVTIRACNMPGLGPMFQLEDGSMSVGVGIHGEAGVSKTKMLPADKIVELILAKLYQRLNVKSGDKVCVIVNNLGGSSQLELFLVAGQVSSQLRGRGVEVVRQYTGTLLTSLDMAGVQVSVLVLPEEPTLWLKCLDMATSAPAWPGNSLSVPSPTHQLQHRHIKLFTDTQPQDSGEQLSKEEAILLKKCLIHISKSLLKNETKLNQLDKGCGDGDTGSTLRRMADAILREVESLPVQYPQLCLVRLSQLAEEVMGGTSGALYSLMLVAASRTAPDWATAWQQAMRLAMTYSKARVGSRTMFDALIPACEEFQISTTKGDDWREALTKAVKAADEGCSNTQHFKPLFGRASYVEASNMKDVDAGAFGVTVWLHAVKSAILEE